MEKANNVYGFEQSSSTTYNLNGNLTGDTNSIDTHMMKNTERGAVTYLYHSKYGRCTDGTCEELTINNCSSYITGIGADTVSASSSSTTCTTPKNQYNGESGVKASTTGNVYGVYDMSGGAYEYVMGNMVDSSNQFYTSNAANWSTTTYPLAKYYDKYSYTDNEAMNAYAIGKLGDATVETQPIEDTYSSWYGNHIYFFYADYGWSWITRGGGYYNSTFDGGLFTFMPFDGGSDAVTARSSLVVLK